MYNKTYNIVVKYVVCKCNNVDDINDIIQDAYIALYKQLLKNNDIDNINNYVIGIAKNKINKYYGLSYKIKNLFTKTEINNLKNNINIEKNIIDKNNLEEIWKYLKNKNIIIFKIFYLYYVESLTIKEISNHLNINESTVKNHLYRTLKELKNIYKGE
ncbi:MAG TPA: sigma-70 family RNA polymerase sigma factor [Candidatus Faecisoma merdavium]|nr:sigma-70 family RNA polymerase sigma factor [Candidatus Faecisoma merdavium]